MLLEMVTNREVFDEAEARHRLASLSYYESKIDYSKAAKGGRGFMKNMGIGAKKLEAYDDRFLRAIERH